MDTISETLGDGKEITNYSNVTWPAIYDDHYESMQNKDYHLFVRGTVVKIDGNYLGSVGQHVSLEIDIVDRDFYNQVYDENYEKALLCYFSYN